jgi:hypothetical protein
VDKVPWTGLEALLTHADKSMKLLDSNENGVLDDGDDYVSVVGPDTVLDLGAAFGGPAGEDTVTVLGVTGLTDADFVA